MNLNTRLLDKRCFDGKGQVKFRCGRRNTISL
jgi:hypothetical protein